MQLFIRGLELNVLNIDDRAVSVLELKHEIAQLEGISVDDQVLSYGGKPLENENTLVYYDINDSATLDVTGRIVGGKI